MLSLDFWLELEHVGLVYEMLFIEYIIVLVTECNFRGAHSKEFSVSPLRLVKHELHLGVLDRVQLIQAVNHDLPLWLQLQGCCLLASHRPIGALLWHYDIGAPT